MKTVLTDAFIKNIKHAGRYTDAATSGLNFNVKSNGGGYWVFRYLFGKKRCDLSLGAYPLISLKEARKRAVTARNELISQRLIGGPKLPKKLLIGRCLEIMQNNVLKQKRPNGKTQSMWTNGSTLLSNMPIQ